MNTIEERSIEDKDYGKTARKNCPGKCGERGAREINALKRNDKKKTRH